MLIIKFAFVCVFLHVCMYSCVPFASCDPLEKRGVCVCVFVCLPSSKQPCGVCTARITGSTEHPTWDLWMAGCTLEVNHRKWGGVGGIMPFVSCRITFCNPSWGMFYFIIPIVWRGERGRSRALAFGEIEVKNASASRTLLRFLKLPSLLTWNFIAGRSVRFLNVLR